MFPGQQQFENLQEYVLDLRRKVEKVVFELHTALLKSDEQKKDLRKALEESEIQNKRLNKVVLEQQSILVRYEDELKDLKNEPRQREAKTNDLKQNVGTKAQTRDDMKEFEQVDSYATAARVNQNAASTEVMTKEVDGCVSKYKRALMQRDLALEELNNISRLLKESQNELESGKKLWEAENISLVEKLKRAEELWWAEKIAMKNLTKEYQHLIIKYNQAWMERDIALNRLNNLGAKLNEVQKDLAKSQDEMGSSKKVWEGERKSLEDSLNIAKEVWEAEKIALKNLIKCQGSTSNCNQALKEQDVTLNELSNIRVELNELELGKKVTDADMTELTKRVKNDFNIRTGADIKDVGVELSNMEKIHKKHMLENENAYCSGYLAAGSFKEPHAYIALPSYETKDVTLPGEPVKATSPRSHTLSLIRRFGNANP